MSLEQTLLRHCSLSMPRLHTSWVHICLDPSQNLFLCSLVLQDCLVHIQGGDALLRVCPLHAWSRHIMRIMCPALARRFLHRRVKFMQSSFLLLVVRHLLLVARHLFLVAFANLFCSSFGPFNKHIHSFAILCCFTCKLNRKGVGEADEEVDVVDDPCQS